MKRRLFLIVVLLFLQGCSSVPALWGAKPFPAEKLSSLFEATPTFTPTAVASSTPSPTAVATATPSPTATATTFFVAPTFAFTPTPAPSLASIKRVIIVSFDGLRADAVEAAPMVNLIGMMKTGAYSLTAQTINYAVMLSAHASMLSGMCQSKHGVDWDVPAYYKGYSKGVDIFDLAHAAGLKTVMIVNKEKMRQLAEPATTDVYQLVYGVEAAIMRTAIEQIPLGFNLMFIHFGSPDTRGHKYGWMSGSQFQALRDGDATLGVLLAALDQYGIRDSTLIIVTADHGGHERGHVGTVIQDLLIPWVAYGPGIQPKQLTSPVSVMDTAATAAFALGLSLPREWDGYPVYEAFGLPVAAQHDKDLKICK